MDNFWYLFAAYSVVWVMLFAYIFILHRRLNAISSELAALKGRDGSCGCGCGK